MIDPVAGGKAASTVLHVGGMFLASEKAVVDELYVRSAHGPNNPWFRRARASGAGRIRASGLERDVSFAEPAPAVHAGIDAAYHAKYDSYGPRSCEPSWDLRPRP